MTAWVIDYLHGDRSKTLIVYAHSQTAAVLKFEESHPDMGRDITRIRPSHVPLTSAGWGALARREGTA